MSVDMRAAVIGTNDPGELDAVARELHGKRYVQLTDAEASAVWDEIERRNDDAEAN